MSLLVEGYGSLPPDHGFPTVNYHIRQCTLDSHGYIRKGANLMPDPTDSPIPSVDPNLDAIAEVVRRTPKPPVADSLESVGPAIAEAKRLYGPKSTRPSTVCLPT